MNVSDEIRRIENDLAYIKIQLSNVRAYGGGHAYPYSDMVNTADPGAPAAGFVRFFANDDHLIGLTDADVWHDLSAGAKGVSSCIHGFITVTDAGGLNITWDAGIIFDALITGGSQIVDIAAQPVNQACAASNINYLFYDHSAGVLVLNTVGPDYTDGDFSIAHILTLHNDILDIFQRPVCYESIHEIKHVLRHGLEAVITEGMLISEHAGAAAFDVDQSQGILIYGGFDVIHGAAIDSTATAIIRWYHNAADAWETDTNAQIDAANWDDDDDGAAPIGNNAAKYYRSTFYTCGECIHWVYPQVEYNNLNAALVAPDPTPPAVLEHLPKTVTVVLKGNAAAFPVAGSDQWIDVRPMIGIGAGGGPITDHVNLSSLAWAGCGHTGTASRYIGFDGAGAAQERTFAQVLADLSAQAGAAFDWNLQNLNNVGTIDLDGGQIAFPAAQSASADVNTLDDYEEGTWTPDLQFGTAKVGITYNVQVGWYTKVGRQVTVTCYVSLSSKGSSVGSAEIFGLPFTIANASAAYAPISFRILGITFANMVEGLGYINSSYLALEEVTEAGIKTDINNTDFINTSYVSVGFSYFTD